MRRPAIPIARSLAFAWALCFGLSFAAGGIDVDLSADAALQDSTRLFFSICARYFEVDSKTVQAWGAHYTNPDDLAVSLFLARRSGKSPDVIGALRRQGLSWWDISLRFGIPADDWFVPVERDPGPPYGKAYGHWKKHQKSKNYVLVLGDADLRNLVALRMAGEYYGVAVDVAMEWRASGRNVRDIMVGEYESRHGKDKGHDPGKGHGKGHEKRSD